MAEHNPYVRLRRSADAINAILITIAVWSASAAEQSVNSLIQRDQTLVGSAALYVTAALIVWAVSTYILLPIIIRCRILRRLLLWNNYVEGVWIETVTFTTGGCGIAVINIAPDGESFRLSGKTYTNDGIASSDFSAEYLTLQWPLLKYKHVNQPYSGKRGEHPLEGIAQLNFEESSRGKPNYYTGYFHHVGSASRNRTEGYRIRQAEARQLGNSDARREIVRKYHDRLHGSSGRAGEGSGGGSGNN